MSIDRKRVAELAAKGKNPGGNLPPVQDPPRGCASLVAFLANAERTVSVIEDLAMRRWPIPEMDKQGFTLRAENGMLSVFQYKVDPVTLKAQAAEALGRAQVHQGIMAKRIRAGGNISARRQAIADRLDRVIRVLENFVKIS
jgi:hypothetical protein